MPLYKHFFLNPRRGEKKEAGFRSCNDCNELVIFGVPGNPLLEVETERDTKLPYRSRYGIMIRTTAHV